MEVGTKICVKLNYFVASKSGISENSAYVVTGFCILQPFSVACGIGLNEFWMWRMSESGK